MKRILFVLSVVLLISSAAYAQKRETRDVPTFTKISFRTAGKIYVKQGSPQKVEIEGTSEVLAKIKTNVDGSRLVVGPEDGWKNWNWNNDDKVTVYVTVARIEGLAVNGSGELIAQTKITGTNIDLDVSGSGSVTAEIEAENVDTDVSGSGNINLKGKFKNVKADVSGSGKVFVTGTVSGKADFEISGSGKIEAEGSADSMSAEISGSGRVMGANFVTNVAKIEIAGSGDVEITVNKDLDADISGSGTVRYKGDPARVNAHSSGSGKVRKM